ncbi:jouberin-like [Dendronephthya gigantea]|uniref:jouberin-like n=1 Tax=Dendronephthya gigantea TaxID=151771 RepID=UPI00106AF184|nr:jouberin-like [Dendronephthya gigantea]
MLEVETSRQVRKSRKKHERSQSASVAIKDKPSKYIEDYHSDAKTSKTLKDAQEKLAALEISGDITKGTPQTENAEKKKKRRRRAQSADQLNDDTTRIRKDQSIAEQNLIQANLYTNDKNKSLEKQTKQSYSEALSGRPSQDETTEDHPGRSTVSERREKRVRKKKNLAEAEVAAAVETAVNVERVRKRVKKKAKHRPGSEDHSEEYLDTPDGHEGTSGTRGDPLDNRGYVDTEHEDKDVHENDGRTKSRSQARENLGYEDEQEIGETSREPKAGRTKTGKRRRKKLKEPSADVIHRALEKKRQDDGHVMCIVIHKADRLKTDLRISHPLVRVHVIDVNTGEYIKKCSRNRAATSYYENQETVDHILPLMTQPFDFKQRKSLVPSWEDVLIINEIYSYFLQRTEGDPNVIIFFEILDFLSMAAINKLKGMQRSDRGWYQIAWAFLKLVGSNGSPNTDTKIRLQLFHPVKYNRRRQLSNSSIPEVYHWWSSPSRQPYPSTLYVTVKGIRPPQDIDAAGRSMFAVQEEKGKMTFEEMTGKIARSESPSEFAANRDIVNWKKLPGQPNRVPNQIMSTLQAGHRGCFVVRFSDDGRKLACGCAEKHGFSIFVFETLSGKNISKFQGHFSIIYDLCWSQNGKEILSASSDGTARSWEVCKDGSPAMKTYPHPCFVYAARYHPQKSLVVTGGFDRLIRIWDKDNEGVNGQLLREMEGHFGFINTICFDPSGRFMFSGDSSGTVIVWETYGNVDARSKKKRSSTAADIQRWVVSKTVKDQEIKDCVINSISLHPNGRKLLVHTRDNVTRMLDLRSFSMMTRYIGANNFKEHVRSTMSTCGSFVFSGSEDGLVYVWDTETGDLVKVYNELGYTAAVSDIDFHPHDNIIAFCSFGQNHPVVLYQHQHTGSVEEIPYIPSSPPMSPLRTTTRTMGQTTEHALTAEPQTMAHTSTHMADVASETLLLNKIKKKLDSVLDVSHTTADLRSSMAGSRTLQRTPSPYAPDLLSVQQPEFGTLSTWGSDFTALPTSPYSPESKPQSPQREMGTRTFSQLETGQPNQGPSSFSRPNSRHDTSVGLFMAKAAYPFSARNPDELNLDEGDVITVLRQEDEHWWVGEMKDGRQGYFPASYTKMMDRNEKKKPKQKERKQVSLLRM